MIQITNSAWINLDRAILVSFNPLAVLNNGKTIPAGLTIFFENGNAMTFNTGSEECRNIMMALKGEKCDFGK